MSFRVLTFNMQFGQGWKKEDPDYSAINLDATLEFLKAHPADVIFLQEVEQAQPNGVQGEPPENYTRIRHTLSSMDSLFAYPPRNRDELPFGIGLAIFSRESLQHLSFEALPPAPLDFEFQGKRVKPSTRQLIGATTFLEGQEVWLLNTHLQAFFMIHSDSNRHPIQRNKIEQIIRGSFLPTILAGDFNCSPEENLVRQFENVGFITAQNSCLTWKRRPYIVDHIFYNASLRCLNHRVLETDSSDHHAVMVELEFVS